MGAGKTIPPSFNPRRSSSSAPRPRLEGSWTSLQPPVSVENWAPYVEDYQSKGAEALWRPTVGTSSPLPRR